MKLFKWQEECFYSSKAKFNIIPAGRRTGKTQGAQRASIIFAAQGDKCLWVDTINSNIDRYYERYYLPDLKAENLEYSWNQQKKILKIENGYIDFRSADRPESIEGFGYDKIYLNEAGLILNNDYLFTNSILPMLMDYDNSQLYAFGTPKGKINKRGEEHRFYSLWQKVVEKTPGYGGQQLSTYSNPILSKENIQELENEMRIFSEEAVQQEVYGLFVEASKDKVFNHNDFDYFQGNDFDPNLIDGRIGAIDVADEGMDYLSFPMGFVLGSKIYITNWLFTQENTEYTIPTSTQLIKDNRLNFCAIETNNHGSLFFKAVQRNITSATKLHPVFQKQNKHSRIIQKAHFIRTHFVFRSDYRPGSDYDLAMKQLFTYTKDGKALNDDSPDSITLLACVAEDLYQRNFQ
mgnify:CR=1 FL=1